MPRIRSFKPELWTSEQFVECSRNARLLFLGTWTFCDDSGRSPYRPKTLKLQIFPGDDIGIEEIELWMEELNQCGLIRLYVVGGERFFHITGWHHQRIDKPQKPRCPAPEEGEIQRTFLECSGNDRGTFLPDPIREDGKGREEDHPPTVPPEDGFDEFWRAYPRKAKKKDAERAWRKVRKADRHQVMTALEVHKKQPQWVKDRGEFIPYPASWLNARQWEDELPPAAGNGDARKQALIDAALEHARGAPGGLVIDGEYGHD